MEHVILVVRPFNIVNELFIPLGTQGDSGQRLGFTPGEQGGAVGAGQHLGFDGNGTDFIGLAAIGTDPVKGFQPQVFANQLRNTVVKGLLLLREPLRQLFLYLRNEGIDITVPGLLGLRAVKVT